MLWSPPDGCSGKGERATHTKKKGVSICVAGPSTLYLVQYGRCRTVNFRLALLT